MSTSNTTSPVPVFETLTSVCEESSDKECCLRYCKLYEYAYDPIKMSQNSAGFLLRSAYEYVLPPRESVLIRSELAVQLPPGCCGRITAINPEIFHVPMTIGNWVVDEDYRGCISALVFSHCNFEITFLPGDYFAQLVVEKILYPKLMLDAECLGYLDQQQQQQQQFPNNVVDDVLSSSPSSIQKE